MNEFESANLETPVEEHELQELVARLSRERDHRTRVLDIAETMDIDPALVAATLNDMRRQKLIEASSHQEVVKTPVKSRLFPKVPRKVVFSVAAVLSLFVFIVSYESTRVRPLKPTLLHELRPNKQSAKEMARRVFNSDGPAER